MGSKKVRKYRLDISHLMVHWVIVQQGRVLPGQEKGPKFKSSELTSIKF